MNFQNPPVLTPNEFRYDTIQIGDLVDQDVVDNAMDCLPPACYCSECAQVGEPYSHLEDPKTGLIRPTFSTFRKVGGEWPNSIWEYCGHCFFGENKDRGKDSVYY